MRTALLLGFCFFAGCAASISLPEGKADQVPDGANRIDLYSDLSVDELQSQVKQFLDSQGFAIAEENLATRRVETEGRDIGQRTSLRIIYRTNPHETGSKLEAIGTWSSDVEEFSMATASQNISGEEHSAYPAVWTGNGRGSFAFAQMVSIFDEFPSREVRYVKQQ